MRRQAPALRIQNSAFKFVDNLLITLFANQCRAACRWWFVKNPSRCKNLKTSSKV